MHFEYTPHFQRQLKKLPNEIQRKFKKQAAYLMHNIRHPSLRAKKYSEDEDVWQARVDNHYRFYFRIKIALQNGIGVWHCTGSIRTPKNFQYVSTYNAFKMEDREKCSRYLHFSRSFK